MYDSVAVCVAAVFCVPLPSQTRPPSPATTGSRPVSGKMCGQLVGGASSCSSTPDSHPRWGRHRTGSSGSVGETNLTRTCSGVCFPVTHLAAPLLDMARSDMPGHCFCGHVHTASFEGWPPWISISSHRRGHLKPHSGRRLPDQPSSCIAVLVLDLLLSGVLQLRWPCT